MQFISRARFLTTLGAVLVSWGSYQDTGLTSGNNAEQNNKTAVNAHGVSPLPTTTFKPNITSVKFNKMPEVSTAAVHERIAETAAVHPSPVTPAPAVKEAAKPAPAPQPVSETVAVENSVTTEPAATADVVLEKKRQAAFTNDYDLFLKRAEDQKLFNDFARQLPLTEDDSKAYANLNAKNYGELEDKVVKGGNVDDIENVQSMIGKLAEDRAADYFFDKRNDTPKSDADYLAAVTRERTMVAQAQEKAAAPVSFAAEYNKFYNQAPATVNVQPATAPQQEAVAETRSIEIGAAESTGWDGIAAAVDSTVFAPKITQPAADAQAALVEPYPGTFDPPESTPATEPVNGMTLETRDDFVGPGYWADYNPQPEDVTNEIVYTAPSAEAPKADVKAEATPVLKVDAEQIAAAPKIESINLGMAPKTEHKYIRVKDKAILDPAYKDKKHILPDYLASVIWRTSMPHYVRTRSDSIAYARLKEIQGAKESTYRPVVKQDETKCFGIWQIHPQTEKGLAKQLKKKLIKTGKAAFTDKAMLIQSEYKTLLDQNSINYFYRIELNRKRKGQPTLMGRDAVAGTNFTKNDKATTHVVLTVDENVITAAMQAGPGFLKQMYNALDESVQKDPKAPVIFDKLYVVKERKKNKKTGRMETRVRKQDFNIFMTFAPQNPAHRQRHIKIAHSLQAKGYKKVFLTHYRQDTQLPEIAKNPYQITLKMPAMSETNMVAQKTANVQEQMRDNQSGLKHKATEEIKVAKIERYYKPNGNGITAKPRTNTVVASAFTF